MRSISGLIILLWFIQIPMAYAQFGEYSLGGRTRAMGGADVTVYDGFSSFSNIGSAAFSDQTSLFFSVGNMYGIEGLNYAGAGYHKKLTRGILTFHVYRFGDRLLNEHKLGVGYGHKIRFVSIGIQLNYIQYKVESFETSGMWIPEFGGLAQLLPRVYVGAYIFNPFPILKGSKSRSTYPALLKTGLSYHPSGDLILNMDLHKHIDESARWCVGLEYNIRQKVFARMGLRSGPARYSFGWGLPLKRISLDYALDLHPLLGVSNLISVQYKPGKG